MDCRDRENPHIKSSFPLNKHHEQAHISSGIYKKIIVLTLKVDTVFNLQRKLKLIEVDKDNKPSTGHS